MHLLYANWMLYLKVTDLTGTGKYFVALKILIWTCINIFFCNTALQTHITLMWCKALLKSNTLKKNSSEKIKEQDARPASKVQDTFCCRAFTIFLHHHYCKYLIRCLGLWNVFYNFSEGSKYNNSSLQHCTAAPLILTPVFMLHWIVGARASQKD